MSVVTEDSRGGYQIPGRLSYDSCEPPNRCWEMNSGLQ